jgi:hypothetical protein
MMSEPFARSTLQILTDGMECRIFPSDYSVALSPFAQHFQEMTGADSGDGKTQDS